MLRLFPSARALSVIASGAKIPWGLLRAMLAFKRGEPRVCSMVRVPTPQDEDRRRICRERKTLTAERIRHVNRIKGLLFSQGIGSAQDRRIRTTRGETHETLKSTRSAQTRLPTAAPSLSCSRDFRRLGAVKGAPCASPPASFAP